MNYNMEYGDYQNYIIVFIFSKNYKERKRDYMTIHELTQNEKYKFWYLKIKECKESDLSVQDFCERNNIKVSTYYRYQQKIKMILCDHINNETELKNEVTFIPVDKQECHNERILIIKGGIKIELDSNTPYSSVEPLLKSLL